MRRPGLDRDLAQSAAPVPRSPASARRSMMARPLPMIGCAAALLMTATFAFAQTPAAPAKESGAPGQANPAPSQAASQPSAFAPATRAPANLTWSRLSASQQTALQPLAARWDEMGEAQKQKWLSLSRNFHTLPPAEQDRVHSRMTEWAALSAQQRTQARITFAQASRLAPDEKKERWEAYQALSEEERKRLAADNRNRPHGAAPAVRAMAPARGARLPDAPASAGSVSRPNGNGAHGLAASPINHNTLLPERAAPAAAD